MSSAVVLARSMGYSHERIMRVFNLTRLELVAILEAYDKEHKK